MGLSAASCTPCYEVAVSISTIDNKPVFYARHAIHPGLLGVVNVLLELIHLRNPWLGVRSLKRSLHPRRKTRTLDPEAV